MNQIRGLLSEHGIVIARDISQLRRGLAAIVGNDDGDISEMIRSLMRELKAELAELDHRIAAYEPTDPGKEVSPSKWREMEKRVHRRFTILMWGPAWRQPMSRGL